MRTHFDLSIPSASAHQPAKALRTALYKCFLLTALLAFLLSAQGPIHQKTLLKEWSNTQMFQDLRTKCESLEFPATVSHLKDNFLTNKRVSDSQLRAVYRDSGLSHLLALSGGQTAPAAYVISLLLTLCTVTVLRLFAPVIPSKCLNSLFVTSLVFEFLTLCFLVCLFQATGALSRALSGKSIEFFRFYGRLSVADRSTAEQWSWHIAYEFAPWIVVWLIHNNPVHDLSFLLSLMGARTAGLVAECCARLNQVGTSSQLKSRTFIFITRLMRPIIFWVSVTSITSALMCLFCAWLWPIDNILQKVQANLIAGPIVLFLITPASLLILAWIILSPQWPPPLLSAFLEWGLSLFHEAAITFSGQTSAHPTRAHSIPHPTFMTDGFEHPYLPLLATIIAISGARWFVQEVSEKPASNSH